MKRYKLLKDLPTFKAGDEFFISECGNLVAGTPEKPKKILIGDGDFFAQKEVNLIAYAKETLERFPNILADWLEEIKEPEVYYYLSEAGAVIESEWSSGTHYAHVLTGEEFVQNLKSIGNYFKTREEAEKHLEWLKARSTLLKDTKGFKPDWNDEDEWKYCVYYNHRDSTFGFGSMSYINDGKIYFETKEDAENSIKLHEKEWKIYLGVE